MRVDYVPRCMCLERGGCLCLCVCLCLHACVSGALTRTYLIGYVPPRARSGETIAASGDLARSGDFTALRLFLGV